MTCIIYTNHDGNILYEIQDKLKEKYALAKWNLFEKFKIVSIHHYSYWWKDGKKFSK